ncbi:MarR family winged helix-turn-helix transcriptional regulator [Streptomyces sp. NPDC017941]|uniref:MarR family winged helix-turn-helix transcriptional regulator n=1 Tax=unclassified Streptomyces TaxID=2593676 RepID=UPI0037927350
MGVNPGSSQRRPQDAASAAREVIELLEVLWERGRDSVPPAPVSTSQLRVLYVLEREDGINLRTLGGLLGAAPSSVSRLCDRLQALGLVERTQSRVSRRELTLHLTGPGRTYLADLRSRREKALTAVIAGMSGPARACLVEGLSGFRECADKTPTTRMHTSPVTGETEGPARTA